MSDVSGRYLILCTSNDVTVERESSFFRQLMLDIVHMGLILFFFNLSINLAALELLLVLTVACVYFRILYVEFNNFKIQF